MIPMKAPNGVASFSYERTQYPVVEGVVEVPPTAAKHALKHGFVMLSAANAEAQQILDLDGAIAKAAAAVPLILMQAPKGTVSAVIDGQQYNVSEDGTVAVPANAERHLKPHGFTKLADVKPVAVEVKQEEEVVADDLPTDDQIEAMTKPQLLAFLEANKVAVTSTTKPELFAATLDWVAAERKRRDEAAAKTKDA